jgi:shikimate dehydrogenase
MTAITGRTRLFAVVGDPIEQVRAPSLLNPLFAELAVDAVLVPIFVHAEHLGEVITGLARMNNFDGLLVTVPHKSAAVAFADEITTTVRIAGATNAMRRRPDGRWLADNFDGVGFVRDLTEEGLPPAGRRVCVVGAGGAGSAIAVALLADGAHVAVCDVDGDRLTALLDRLREHWPDQVSAAADPAAEDADIVVNATPLGLRPADPLPFQPALLRQGTVVADIIMSPRRTRLLAAAEEHGLRTHYGLGMLTRQLDCYRSFFELGAAPLPAPEHR